MQVPVDMRPVSLLWRRAWMALGAGKRLEHGRKSHYR